MGLISINKLTGKMIESQSGGETHPDPKIDGVAYAKANLETLRQNAVNAGYALKDVEVKFVTQEEYEILLEASKPEPTPEQIYEEQVTLKEKEILRTMAIAELEAEVIIRNKPITTKL